MSLEHTISTIESLKKLDLSNYPIDEINSSIKRLWGFPAYTRKFHVGHLVYRIRPNKSDPTYSHTKELTYVPQIKNESFQRASSPGNTMFYAGIIPIDNAQSEIDIGRLIAISEGSKIFRDKGIEEGQETVTLSKWRLQDTVELVTILNPNIKKNITPFAKKCALELMEFLKLNPEREEAGKAILTFYAEQFAKKVEIYEPNYNYLHSALFTEYILSRNFHGVCYPSSRLDGKGINVAIHPSFVDAHMRVEVVVESIIAKRGKKIVCEDYKMALVNVGETKLNFKELKSPEEVQENIEISLSRI